MQNILRMKQRHSEVKHLAWGSNSIVEEADYFL